MEDYNSSQLAKYLNIVIEQKGGINKKECNKLQLMFLVKSELPAWSRLRSKWLKNLLEKH